MTGFLLLDALLFLYSVAAPGIAVTRVTLNETNPLVVGSVGLTLGTFALPLIHFVVAVIFGTHISVPLLLINATVILLACGAAHRVLGQSKATLA
ncbi:MAG: hypothetical protein ACI9WU_001601 [Myxococcota bacterium]|jgi:hypothetical protein